MSLGVTLSKDYKGPMEIGDYMRKVKSQYSLGKMISSYNKRYFVLDLHYKQFYYLPKKDSHYADSHQIFLGEIAKITYDHHLVLNDDQVWKYGIIIYARKKEYHLHSCSKEFIEALLFAFSHLIDSSTKTPLFNWEAYQAQIKKFETQHFSFNPQGTITLQKPIQSQPQSPEVLSSTPASVTKNPNKEESNSKKSLLEENQSPRASDKTSAPSSQTEAQDEPIEKPLEVAKDNTPPETPVETPQTLPVRENVQVVKVETTTPVIKMETNITRLRAASRNRRNNSMSVSNNFEIANFIQQSKETKNSELAGMNQVDVSQAKPQEKTNNIWGNPTHARTRNASIDARQRNKEAVHHQRAKLISFRGSGISIESPELSKQSNTADRQDSTTPETNNSSPPKSSCDEDNQTPLNNEDWDKELFGGDDDKKQVNIRMKKSSRNPENYNFRPAVPVHNDWDDELDL